MHKFPSVVPIPNLFSAALLKDLFSAGSFRKNYRNLTQKICIPNLEENNLPQNGTTSCAHWFGYLFVSSFLPVLNWVEREGQNPPTNRIKLEKSQKNWLQKWYFSKKILTYNWFRISNRKLFSNYHKIVEILHKSGSWSQAWVQVQVRFLAHNRKIKQIH